MTWWGTICSVREVLSHALSVVLRSRDSHVSSTHCRPAPTASCFSRCWPLLRQDQVYMHKTRKRNSQDTKDLPATLVLGTGVWNLGYVVRYTVLCTHTWRRDRVICRVFGCVGEDMCRIGYSMFPGCCHKLVTVCYFWLM